VVVLRHFALWNKYANSIDEPFPPIISFLGKKKSTIPHRSLLISSWKSTAAAATKGLKYLVTGGMARIRPVKVRMVSGLSRC
jgi:hypothetical protein